MDDIIRAVSDAMPKFDDFTLRGYIRQVINDSHIFVDTCYREATRLNGKAIRYLGHEILSPEERVKRELGWSKRPKVSLSRSDVQLVEYKIEHEGVVHSAYLYTPYLFHDYLNIKGKRYSINLGIVEKTFSRITDKSTDGVMIRTIRAPIPFSRKIRHRIAEYRSGQIVANEFIITAKLHHKKHGKRKTDTTAVLYLLAKFGFDDTVFKFGLTRNDICFVDQPDLTDNDHLYFYGKREYKPGSKEAAREREREKLLEAQRRADGKQPDELSERDLKNLFLKVRREVFENMTHRKLVCNILYLLAGFDFQTLKGVYEDYGGCWRIMLGKIIHPEVSHVTARSNADTHLLSVDTFIDPISRKRYNDFGMQVRDVYDLLIFVFENIDGIMVNTMSQDLYTKRIDVMDGLLVAPFATAIFSKFYGTNQKSVLRESEVKTLVKMRPWTMDSAWSSGQRGLVQNVTTGTQIFNGNWLSSFGIFKNRPDGSAEQRFHPSMAVVESITAFSGNDVGRTGFINPFLHIGPNGGINRPDYAEDIEIISRYMPRN